MLKAVVFDLDGTLLDTKPFIVASYKHVCESFGIKVITEQMIQELGGAGLHDTYKHFHPNIDVEKLTNAHLEFQGNSLSLIKPFSDTITTLDRIVALGLKNAIVTARHNNAHILLETSGISRYFSTVVTCDDITDLKPHPEGLLLALERLAVEPSEAIYIGDMKADIEMGKNAGVFTIGVACGFSTVNELDSFRPDFIVDPLSSALSVIDGLLSKPG